MQVKVQEPLPVVFGEWSLEDGLMIRRRLGYSSAGQLPTNIRVSSASK
jgi:hypothetical protein